MARTLLHSSHVAAGATMFEFGGWEMPLQFTSIVGEHMAVRQDAGLFDVSHMGKVLVSGAGAWALVQKLSTNTIPKSPMRARYTHLLDEGGRILDDVIVTCLSPDRYFLVCNAGPRASVLRWISEHARDEDVADLTEEYLCLALQGPKAARVLQLVTAHDLDGLRAFRGTLIDLLLGRRLGTTRPRSSAPLEMEGWGTLGDAALVTRTGYTGEDGFEIFPHRDIGLELWTALLTAGSEHKLRRVGLGARDTLRLEKGLLLSGTDFDGSQTPLESACEWVVKWDHEFIGREALSRQRDAGTHDRLVGLLLESGVPRHGNEVFQGEAVVGIVTSGSHSPMLRRGIALARVRPSAAAVGTSLSVAQRSRLLRATVTKPPFV